METEKVLQSLGLNDKETAIYLALLPLGSAPASILGKRTNIARTTAKFTCDQLVSKGLLLKTPKNNATIYTVLAPEKLLDLLDQKKEEIHQQEEDTHRIIGELKQLYNPHTILPSVRFYEGKDGLIELYDQLLAKKSPIDSFEDKGEMAQFIPEYVPKFIKTRIENKIFNRVICPASNPINKSTPKELREARNIPLKEFPFSCDIKITEDLVAIFSFDKGSATGISIEHADIASNFRLLFEYFWKHLGS